MCGTALSSLLYQLITLCLNSVFLNDRHFYIRKATGGRMKAVFARCNTSIFRRFTGCVGPKAMMDSPDNASERTGWICRMTIFVDDEIVLRDNLEDAQVSTYNALVRRRLISYHSELCHCSLTIANTYRAYVICLQNCRSFASAPEYPNRRQGRMATLRPCIPKCIPRRKKETVEKWEKYAW